MPKKWIVKDCFLENADNATMVGPNDWGAENVAQVFAAPGSFEARLIASSPELLSALEAIEKRLAFLDDGVTTPCDEQISDAWKLAARAIAIVRGCRQCGGSGKRATARSANGRELERHEKSGTPCDACGGKAGDK
jgi:hypothetical protein